MDYSAKYSINLRMAATVLLLLGSSEFQSYFETEFSNSILNLNIAYEIHHTMWGSWNIVFSASF